jgi:MFS family permease
MNVRLNTTSTFAALQNPVYRKLWFAILLSGTCVAAQDTAATWTMNMLGSSTFLLSLISTVASLPFFLFTLPAGALADMVNRRKLLCIMNLWLAGAAVLLAILGSFQLLNPYVLLFCVFLIGVGFAFHAPAWSAIVQDVVTDEELPSAPTLGGLQLNVSGIIGPVPQERYYLSVNRELDARGTTVIHPSSMHTTTLDLGAQKVQRTS